MRLPFNVPIMITVTVRGKPKKVIVIAKSTSPTSGNSLDDISYHCLVYAVEWDGISSGDPSSYYTDPYMEKISIRDIKKWKSFKRKDAPLTINWKYLSPAYKKIYFGR